MWIARETCNQRQARENMLPVAWAGKRENQRQSWETCQHVTAIGSAGKHETIVKCGKDFYQWQEPF